VIDILMSERNLEIAAFLKSRRRRLTPASVGLPQGLRRRIDTLRREDVAWLADVGITWYTWLEQGRPIKMAAGTLARVSAALRLDPAESEYLGKLVQSLGKAPRTWERGVSERVRALVDSYSEGYAFVTDPCWDVLVWNDRFASLFGLNGETGGLEQNGLWIMFMNARVRLLFPDWEAIARRMVAIFRVEHAEFGAHPNFAAVVEKLSARSSEFATMWSHVEVFSPMAWSVGALRDPGSGTVTKFQTIRLPIPDSPGQTLVFYVPADGAATVAPLPELAPAL
jgi:PAS domain-containing protein